MPYPHFRFEKARLFIKALKWSSFFSASRCVCWEWDQIAVVAAPSNEHRLESMSYCSKTLSHFFELNWCYKNGLAFWNSDGCQNRDLGLISSMFYEQLLRVQIPIAQKDTDAMTWLSFCTFVIFGFKSCM